MTSPYQQRKITTHLQYSTQFLCLRIRQRRTDITTHSLLGTALWITRHHTHWCVSPHYSQPLSHTDLNIDSNYLSIIHKYSKYTGASFTKIISGILTLRVTKSEHYYGSISGGQFSHQHF